MAWAIFGGYFLWTEHAPWWLQGAFYVAVVLDYLKERHDALARLPSPAR